MKCEQRLIYWFSTNKLFTLFSRKFSESPHRILLSLSSPATVTLSKRYNNIELNRFVYDTL